MPIEYGETNYLSTLVFASSDFFSGTATTTLGWTGSVESVANATDLADLIVAAWDVHWQPITDTDTTLTLVRVETATFSVEVSAALAGTSSFTSAAPQVAALLRKSAAGKGRRNRGRNFWPAVLTQTNVGENGIIVGSRMTDLTTAIEGFVGAVLAPEDPVQALSIPQSNEPGQESDPIVPWPIVTEFGFDTRVATQRRRVRK